MKSFTTAAAVMALVAAALLLAACGSSGGSQVGVDEGIDGEVIFWEGDFMPVSPTGTKTPVARDIYIHEATTSGMAEQDGFGPFYTAVNSALVTVVSSNQEGFFQAGLTPGTYSLFVKEGDLFYANCYNGGLIMPVTVEPGAVTRVTIKINYLATF